MSEKIKLKFNGRFGNVYGVAFWLHYDPAVLAFDKFVNIGAFDDVQVAQMTDPTVLACSASLQGTKQGITGEYNFMEIYFDVISGGEVTFYSSNETVQDADGAELKKQFNHLSYSAEFINVIEYEIESIAA